MPGSSLNLRMLDALDEGADPATFIATHDEPFGEPAHYAHRPKGRGPLRQLLDTLPAANHLNRPEVVEALAHGSGYTIRRHSESTHRNYFYSAMLGERGIVRSAVPYPCR